MSKHIVDESKVTYYVNWVTWCLKDSHKSIGDELTSSETDQFLRKLSKTKDIWQVDQASIIEKQQWEYMANEMKNMLRLKQRAISTERTYLHWLSVHEKRDQISNT